MTKDEVRQYNAALQEHAAAKLGDLYDCLEQMTRTGDESMDRFELDRLCAHYGEENVRWMVGVMKEDRG